jgi:hypothetical protein
VVDSEPCETLRLRCALSEATFVLIEETMFILQTEFFDTGYVPLALVCPSCLVGQINRCWVK